MVEEAKSNNGDSNNDMEIDKDTTQPIDYDADQQRADDIARELELSELREAEQAAKDAFNKESNRLVKCEATADTITDERQAIMAKYKEDLDAVNQRLEQAKAEVKRQQQAACKAKDAAETAAQQKHKFQHPMTRIPKKRSADQADERVKTEPDGIAHNSPDTSAGLDVAIAVPERCRADSVGDINITEADRGYFYADLAFMIEEPPHSWPPRFHEDISAKAAVLRRLMPGMLSSGATLHDALCFLQQTIYEKGSVAAITKLTIAATELLNVLRAAQLNRVTDEAPWNTQQKSNGTWVTVAAKRQHAKPVKPHKLGRTSSAGGWTSSSSNANTSSTSSTATSDDND
eukprot:g10394.t1